MTRIKIFQLLFIFLLIYDKIRQTVRKSEVRKIKNKKALSLFAVVLFLNFILFAVKLYVGLSSNSISIYSDGINNLFDGVSAATGISCFLILAKGRDLSFASRSEKTEQLLSFALSAVIPVTGFIFLFNSAERLMYPAPVWFTVSYFYIILVTAIVKLMMFFYLKVQSKRCNSPMIKVMSLDSLMDFFITVVTVITLYASQKGGFSLDAYAGIVISVFILISGVKSFKENLVKLIGFPERKLREKTERLISEQGIKEVKSIEFCFSEEKMLLVRVENSLGEKELDELRKKVKKETGFSLYLLK